MLKAPEARGPPTHLALSQASPAESGEGRLGARPVFLTLLCLAFPSAGFHSACSCLPGFLVVEKLQSLRS